MKNLSPREKVEYILKRYLNKKLILNAYYDCGPFGILNIYWFNSGWRTDWITIEKCPVDLQEEFHLLEKSETK
jgi:hypothetical protein